MRAVGFVMVTLPKNAGQRPALLDFDPAMIFRGLQDGVGHLVRGQPLAERGRGALSFGGGGQEIGSLMDERMFVPDLQTGYPPVAHVRMVAIRNVQTAPS